MKGESGGLKGPPVLKTPEADTSRPPVQGAFGLRSIRAPFGHFAPCFLSSRPHDAPQVSSVVLSHLYLDARGEHAVGGFELLLLV